MLADLLRKLKPIAWLPLVPIFAGCQPAFARDPYQIETRKLRGEVQVTVQGRFKITNLDPFDWKECLFEINPGTATASIFRMDLVRSGAVYTIEARQFASRDGYRFLLETMKPLRFRVRCGDERNPINPPGELQVEMDAGGLDDT